MAQLVKLIELPSFQDTTGNLIVIEGESKFLPFSIARIFNVIAKKGSIRGEHAHKNCSQFFICTNGAVEITCDDASNKEAFVLDCPNYGLFVPPGIWAEQKYLEENTVITVMCDESYDKDDYINNYEEFLKYVNI